MGPGSAARRQVRRAASGASPWLMRFLDANRYPLRSKTLTLLRLAGEPLQQSLDFAVLLALAVGPFADHLLLGPHMRDQALDGFGQIGHRPGGAAARDAFLQGQPQPLDRGLKLAAAAG